MKNKPDGQGRVKWSNGATYTGHFLEGKYHGLGVYVYPSGKKFVGRWENGLKSGHGIYTWPNGKKYDGEYKDGVKDGYGRITWPDGSNYCGGFRRNRRSGRGVHTDPEGKVIHCGEWKADLPVLDANGSPDTSGSEGRNLLKGVPKDVMIEEAHDLSLKSLRGKGRNFGQRAGQPSGVASPKSVLEEHSEKSDFQRDICSPGLVADSDDDESCDSRRGVDYEKVIAPTQLVV